MYHRLVVSDETITPVINIGLAPILGTIITAVPFILGGPQWLIGTIVNAGLFLAAMKLKKNYWWWFAILPSLGATARGVIFGPMTIFLIYFLPAIWLGNYLLMTIFAAISRTHGQFLATGAGSLVKFTVLALTAQIYYYLKLAPQIFTVSMGLIQLITALSGGLIAYLAVDYHQKWTKPLS